MEENVYSSVVGAFHDDTPLQNRSFFQPWRDLEQTIERTRDVLGDVGSSHEVRIKRAISEVFTGNTLVCSIEQVLMRLSLNVDLLFKRYRDNWSRNINIRPNTAQRDRALWSWISCLPETSKQIRAGKLREQIISNVLRPVEEQFEPEAPPIVVESSAATNTGFIFVIEPLDHISLREYEDDWAMADALNRYHSGIGGIGREARREGLRQHTLSVDN